MYKKQVLEHFVIKNGEDTRTQTLDVLIVKNLFQFANQKCTVIMLGTCRYMIANMYVKQYRLYLCSFNLTNLQNPPITSFSYAWKRMVWGTPMKSPPSLGKQWVL